MTGPDLQYVQQLIAERVITGPVLELGAGYGGSTCRGAITTANMVYFASDIVQSPGVDFVADFENADSVEKAFGKDNKFGCILVLNVLEHTFEPIAVLDNVASLLSSTGSLVVITPAIWTLHNYPIDCYRLLPNFYEQYASKRGMVINSDYFQYVGIGKVSDNLNSDGNYWFPLPTQSQFKYWKSRLIQKIFNTYGRGMAFPSHVAIGAVLSRP